MSDFTLVDEVQFMSSVFILVITTPHPNSSTGEYMHLYSY